jgi:hypothetical protein
MLGAEIESGSGWQDGKMIGVRGLAPCATSIFILISAKAKADLQKQKLLFKCKDCFSKVKAAFQKQRLLFKSKGYFLKAKAAF